MPTAEVTAFYDRLRKILPPHDGAPASDADIEEWVLQLPARKSFSLMGFQHAIAEAPRSAKAHATCMKARRFARMSALRGADLWTMVGLKRLQKALRRSIKRRRKKMGTHQSPVKSKRKELLRYRRPAYAHVMRVAGGTLPAFGTVRKTGSRRNNH